MSTVLTQVARAIVTVMSTSLNALANNTGALGSTVAANTANGDLYADFFLSLAAIGAAYTGGSFDLYIVRQDGTTYEDSGVTTSIVRPTNGYVGSFIPQLITGAQFMTIPDVKLPPLDFKLYLYNNATGQTTAATTNTVTMIASHGLQT